MKCEKSTHRYRFEKKCISVAGGGGLNRPDRYVIVFDTSTRRRGQRGVLEVPHCHRKKVKE